MKHSVMLALFLLAACAGGCSHSIIDRNETYVKPTVAVMKFENRSGFPLSWNLGDGMADVLVDRLVQTNRYHVVERPELNSLLEELRLQQSQLTREEGRAQVGRIKNVRYLIKGTVTDFGHVSSTSGFFLMRNLSIFGGGNRAVMGVTMYVVDVESGEIVASESIEESVNAKDLNVKAVYQNTAFGGKTFYQTPLGKATRRVIDRAVARVSDAIARQKWEPRVAMVNADGSVILNGGKDRGIIAGQQLDVLQPGAAIIDPDTGDVIGQSGVASVGRLQVVSVEPRYCVARPVTALAKPLEVGQRCRR